jgi:hypothetical protein
MITNEELAKADLQKRLMLPMIEAALAVLGQNKAYPADIALAVKNLRRAIEHAEGCA